MHMSTYQSSDFVTISTLVLRKHQLVRIERSNPRRAVFEFERTPQLEDDVDSLRRGDLLVDPTDFWAAERRAKQLIYEEERL